MPLLFLHRGYPLLQAGEVDVLPRGDRETRVDSTALKRIGSVANRLQHACAELRQTISPRRRRTVALGKRRVAVSALLGDPRARVSLGAPATEALTVGSRLVGPANADPTTLAVSVWAVIPRSHLWLENP